MNNVWPPEPPSAAGPNFCLKFKNIISVCVNNTPRHFLPISQALWIPGRDIWTETAGYKALMGPGEKLSSCRAAEVKSLHRVIIIGHPQRQPSRLSEASVISLDDDDDQPDNMLRNN